MAAEATPLRVFRSGHRGLTPTAIGCRRCRGWGLAFTYNYGRTWNYVLPATCFSARAGVLDPKAFWLHDAHGGIISIYRRK